MSQTYGGGREPPVSLRLFGLCSRSRSELVPPHLSDYWGRESSVWDADTPGDGRGDRVEFRDARVGVPGRGLGKTKRPVTVVTIAPSPRLTPNNLLIFWVVVLTVSLC